MEKFFGRLPQTQEIVEVQWTPLNCARKNRFFGRRLSPEAVSSGFSPRASSGAPGNQAKAT